MIKLDNKDLEVLKEAGEKTMTYYTTEPDGYLITKDNLISCIEDLLGEIYKRDERIKDLEDIESWEDEYE